MFYLVATIGISVFAFFGARLLFNSKQKLRGLAAGIPKIFLPIEMVPDSKQEAAIFLFWRFVGGFALTAAACMACFVLFQMFSH